MTTTFCVVLSAGTMIEFTWENKWKQILRWYDQYYYPLKN